MEAVTTKIDLQGLAYETYAMAVACGDEYANCGWTVIVADIYGDEADHSALVAELQKRFPL